MLSVLANQLGQYFTSCPLHKYIFAVVAAYILAIVGYIHIGIRLHILEVKATYLLAVIGYIHNILAVYYIHIGSEGATYILQL